MPGIWTITWSVWSCRIQGDSHLKQKCLEPIKLTRFYIYYFSRSAVYLTYQLDVSTSKKSTAFVLHLLQSRHTFLQLWTTLPVRIETKMPFQFSQNEKFRVLLIFSMFDVRGRKSSLCEWQHTAVPLSATAMWCGEHGNFPPQHLVKSSPHPLLPLSPAWPKLTTCPIIPLWSWAFNSSGAYQTDIQPSSCGLKR
jgi:hypothetical protein